MVVTRFAPSPTGMLHVGGARTALFNFLEARHHGGRFLLRVEDTDRQRSTPAAVAAILDGMAWLGLAADAEPVFQTRRFDRYRQVLEQLLAAGLAYRCVCSPQTLEEMRAQAMARGDKPRYDGRCRQRSGPVPGDLPSVVRFRTPPEGQIVIDDRVRGRVVIDNAELDDLVLWRSDDTPTYNFAVVVDDADMGVTEVIRGDDHLNNTPRQIHLYRALGLPEPRFAHLPMILGPDGSKLSKRHGAVSVLEYREQGFLPIAMRNYLARLGWSHGDQELFDDGELIAAFSVDAVNASASRFDLDKLRWVNQHWLKTLEPALWLDELRWHFARQGLDPDAGPDLAAVALALRERCATLAEMTAAASVWFRPLAALDPEAARKHLTPAAAPVLGRLRAELAALPAWETTAIHGCLETVVRDLGLGFGKVAAPLRVALTGSMQSPAIDVTVWLTGREQALARLDAALARLSG